MAAFGAWLSQPTLSVLALVILSGCASQAPVRASYAPGGSIDCVPFARALTGVSLQGDGPEWWQAAEGQYQRSTLPDVGAIMVFRRSSRLPHGHVSVVSRVVSRREIWVTHANWVHGLVTQDQPVDDVSSANDWTMVRVWWAPSGRLGATLYAVLGFILPDRMLGHDAIAARTAEAASMASQQH